MNNTKNFDLSISVIIPAYNSSKTIKRCLDSVINQTVPVDEIIITNDGSTDNTLEILHQYKKKNQNIRIIIINQNNMGIGAARNSALKKCKSNYVAFLDSDDVWFKTKIERCKQELIINNEIDLIYHNEVKIIKSNKIFLRYGKIRKPYFYSLIFHGNKLSPSGVILKFSILKNVGFFSENLKFNSAEDFDVWLKISLKNINIFYLNEYLGKYIINDNSITNEKIYHFNNVQNVLSKHLENQCSDNIFKKNFLLKNKLIFYLINIKFFFLKFDIINIIKSFFLIISIIFKSNIVILIQILFKSNIIFNRISKNEIES